MLAPRLVRTAITRLRNGRRTLTITTNEPARMPAGVLERKVRRTFTRVRRVAGPATRRKVIVVPLGILRPGTYRVRYRLVDAAKNRSKEHTRSFVVPPPKPG